ncbi:palmitoyltransferase ZDHHC22-like [Glandiceps talaboti]
MQRMQGFTHKINSQLNRMASSNRVLWYANAAGMVYYWLVYAAVFYTVVFVSMPVVYEEDNSNETVQMLIFVFVMINTMANYIMAVRSKSFYRATPFSAPNPVPKNWRHCITCQQDIPPRTHHCPLCGYCVLKREEHCFFIGTCIGYYNHRYFIVLAFYASIAASYGITYAAMYLSYTHGSFSETGLSYFLPVTFLTWRFGFGSMPTYIFAMVFLMYVCITALFMAGGLFVWNMYNVRKGQTRHESIHDGPDNIVVESGWQNFQDTFGKNWLLCFIIPAFTPLQGDGITWNKHKQIKGI